MNKQSTTGSKPMVQEGLDYFRRVTCDSFDIG